MINGAHVIVYSQNAEADRAFSRMYLIFNRLTLAEGG